ncbi:MAG: sn-glycerol-1-phosphate dehydrogenase [Clostridiales bacterium]|nr:sn-glycerol-1-phosphate dehydrogenase [Clostridiales bacterium]
MAEIKTDELIARGEFNCKCGKHHAPKVKKAIIESGAIEKTPSVIKEYHGTKVFVLDDVNTHAAAGERLVGILEKAGIPYSIYTFTADRTEPDEHAVGSVILHYDSSCDIMVSVGSGVINDIGKIVAGVAKIPYIIVGTAPSMDGYASGTSSVIRDNLKVSVDSHCPDVVIGDLDILAEAPMKMIASGFGDMIAKYISIAEWRISHIINGEYYCDEVANLVCTALDKCVQNVSGIRERDKDAVAAVMEGMVISGIAANYAGVSRPVSGMEHYFSHVWDMRMVEFGTVADFHGIQCGIGTLDSIRVYDKIKKITPSKEKALAHAAFFNYDEWKEVLIKYLGKGADMMILNEQKEKKYDVEAHAKRIERIIDRWDEIIDVINTLPSYDDLAAVFDAAGAPKTVEEIGVTKEAERAAFLITKDIRDKYIGSRLLWDLGELEEVCDELFPE